MGTFVVVVGGGLLPLPLRLDSGRGQCPSQPASIGEVVAVDGGLDVALAAGLTPTRLVGDLDSVSAGGLEWARRAGIAVEAHPSDKDATDTALALTATAALAAGDPAPVLHLLCGSASDRLDHMLGVICALGAADLSVFSRVRADIGAAAVHVVHAGRRAVVDLPSHGVFSLLALHGECAGVSVEGARWPLTEATLPSATTWGISNESRGAPVRIGCGRGVLTVVVPAVAQCGG